MNVSSRSPSPMPAATPPTAAALGEEDRAAAAPSADALVVHWRRIRALCCKYLPSPPLLLETSPTTASAPDPQAMRPELRMMEPYIIDSIATSKRDYPSMSLFVEEQVAAFRAQAQSSGNEFYTPGVFFPCLRGLVEDFYQLRRRSSQSQYRPNDNLLGIVTATQNDTGPLAAFNSYAFDAHLGLPVFVVASLDACINGHRAFRLTLFDVITLMPPPRFNPPAPGVLPMTLPREPTELSDLRLSDEALGKTVANLLFACGHQAAWRLNGLPASSPDPAQAPEDRPAADSAPPPSAEGSARGHKRRAAPQPAGSIGKRAHGGLLAQATPASSAQADAEAPAAACAATRTAGHGHQKASRQALFERSVRPFLDEAEAHRHDTQGRFGDYIKTNKGLRRLGLDPSLERSVAMVSQQIDERLTAGQQPAVVIDFLSSSLHDFRRTRLQGSSGTVLGVLEAAMPTSEWTAINSYQWPQGAMLPVFAETLVTQIFAGRSKTLDDLVVALSGDATIQDEYLSQNAAGRYAHQAQRNSCGFVRTNLTPGPQDTPAEGHEHRRNYVPVFGSFHLIRFLLRMRPRN